MTLFVNKRQQARNERALQELISNVPGNDRCADCLARNPGWASWSLGIFLCMRCAALHRKLGTHISKVKSLSMDTWVSDQVEVMKKTGNAASNRVYNPRNVRPDIPLDPDEIDTAMEKFVRAKYQRRTLGNDDSRDASRHNTGSTSSTDDHPPPVPEKNTPRFGSTLRAASSTYPVPRTDRPLPPIKEPNGAERPTLETLGRQGSNEDKLATLRSMGFVNERRNLTLLKGLDGSIDRTVQALVRLGEGDDATRTAVATGTNAALPARTDSLPTSTNGIHSSSRNTPVQEQNQAYHAPISTGGNIQNLNSSSSRSFNPFDRPIEQTSAQSTPGLESSFQNINISQQPLFPNNTGTWQAQNQHNPFLKTLTPPISPSPYQYTSDAVQGGFQQNFVPQRGYTDPAVSMNPFLQPSRSQTFTPSGLSNQVQITPQPPSSMLNPQSAPTVPSVPPWAQSQRSESPVQFPQNGHSSFFGQMNNSYPTLQQAPGSNGVFQQPPLSQAQYQQQVFSESPIPSPGVQTPSSYGGQQTAPEYPFQSQQPQYQQNNQQQQQQPPAQFQITAQPQQAQNQQQYAAPRFDKSSILALYNQPHLALSPAQPQATGQTGQAPSEPYSTAGQPETQPTNAPNPGNPFMNLQVNAGGLGHMREESKDFIALMSRNSGRHSPDAFAGLSARYR